MKKTVKLGVVGFGRIVELVHLPILKKIHQIEVHGIFDITPQRLELAAKRGFQTYAHLDELLDSSVDAVLIATPPHSHFEVASAALRKGKHVIVEKPVTESLNEAVQLLELSQMEKKAVTVFQNRRFDSDYLFVKQMLAEERLGRILFVERRHHMFGSGASFGVKSFYPDWRNEARFGGGALLDWGVHLVDQLLRLQLGEIESVEARKHVLRWGQGDVDDYVYASMRLDNGILMSMEINFGSNAEVPIWIIGGEKATLQINNTKEAYLLEKGKPRQMLTISDSKEESADRIYSSFAGFLLREEELVVSLDQAIESMDLIDKINKQAIK
ncbi:gfo/Idh/MocA family oxidoreductase [Cohnella endophytica]|uniref:Gfo/Idh/MocA family oxidoreductase n=1 Tax=Cohnella endophytica TaxID=2419778 RepID=A0A494XUX9_9BACL|nr:Gfo/Idh/MocA family oxidoreductase [Cohnella endophytica]RKP54421.1 gfo/Idh/MocA family oxidoreductase [Cohnella endophytica]